MVTALLGLQLIIGGFSVYLATADKSVAVVPDYHAVALNWDNERASRMRIAQRGWTVRTALIRSSHDVVAPTVRVHIQDKSGKQVDGLNLSGSAFHHARGNDSIDFGFESIGGGQYGSWLR